MEGYQQPNLPWLPLKLIWASICFLNQQNMFGDQHGIEGQNEDQHVICFLKKTLRVIFNAAWLRSLYLLLLLSTDSLCILRSKTFRCLRKALFACLLARTDARINLALKPMVHSNVWLARCLFHLCPHLPCIYEYINSQVNLGTERCE